MSLDTTQEKQLSPTAMQTGSLPNNTVQNQTLTPPNTTTTTTTTSTPPNDQDTAKPDAPAQDKEAPKKDAPTEREQALIKNAYQKGRADASQCDTICTSNRLAGTAFNWGLVLFVVVLCVTMLRAPEKAKTA
jgi:hypothetical protein